MREGRTTIDNDERKVFEFALKWNEVEKLSKAAAVLWLLEKFVVAINVKCVK